ncbi:hypothetical protein AB0G85_36555 [Streptomyces sioyaensis]|uniref:hypothetical protein n=1 Tax=Streptomyces sioyaensis TaxID=67364 RepID=UPI0033C1E00D
MLRAQTLVLEAVHNGTERFGLYRGIPVADFLNDIRTLSRLLLSRPDHELAQHLPEDITDAFLWARDTARSTSASSQAHSTPAAPTRAEITAAVVTLATQALSMDDVEEAGAALAWAFTPVPGTPAGRALIKRRDGTSELVLALQAAALHRPTSTSALPVRPRPDRTAHLPSLLWPVWTVALAPPLRHHSQTFQDLCHGLSVLLALNGSTDAVHDASRRLGSCLPPDHVALLLHRLKSHPEWPTTDAALTALADHLNRHGSPIDYQRRRRLDYRTLLPEDEWKALSRRAHHFPGDSRKPLTARRWLFERLSGLPAEQAPADYALTEPRQRAELSAFATFLTPRLLAELDAHAGKFLNRHRVTGEPVTWHPPTTLLVGRRLPGTDLGQCQAVEIHRLIRSERLTPRAVAKKLDLTTDAVRCLLGLHPAPLSVTQQRSSGRVTWALSDRLPPEELRRLHHHEQQSVPALAERFRVSRKVIDHLLNDYGIPRRHRQARSIDAAWLRYEYVNRNRTLPDIAAELGISITYLNRRAKAMGIPLRPRGHGSRPKDRLFDAREKALAQEMLASGNYSVREVADHLGFTARTIYRHIDKEHWSKAPKRKQAPRDPDARGVAQWPREAEDLDSLPLHDHE